MVKSLFVAFMLLLMTSTADAANTKVFTSPFVGGTAKLNPSVMAATTLELKLPTGKVVTIDRQNYEEDNSHAARTWVGEAEDEPGSILALTAVRGEVTGFFNYAGENWEITPSGSVYLMETGSADLQANYSTPTAVVPDGVETLAEATSPVTVVDVMIAYTTAVKTANGSSASRVESLILNGVAMANQAYRNSNIPMALHVVGMPEATGYVETGVMNTSLTDLATSGDGKLDTLLTLRTSLNADLVQLLTMDTDWCGFAYIPSVMNAAAGLKAFSIVKPSCIGNQSVAHEFGHNMGLEHDRENDYSTTPFPYARGYTDCKTFRDIMAYPCGGAKRIVQFSNPGIYLNGLATGISYEADATNSADNSRALRNVVATVAAWKGGTPSTISYATVPTTFAVVNNTTGTSTVSWATAPNATSVTVKRSKWNTTSLTWSTPINAAVVPSPTLSFIDKCGVGKFRYYAFGSNFAGVSANTATIEVTVTKVL